MSPVDVDVTSIPDMIEAQLTLSYSRLANLVRLIIDQGNGHEVDIDKLSSRVDALKDENTALRSTVESLLAEKTRDKDVATKIEDLRQEVLHVSDVCAENSKQIAALADQSRRRFEDWDERLNLDSQHHLNEVDKIYTSVRGMQKVVSELEEGLGFLNKFVELWESSEDKIDVLTKRDTNGEFQCSTDKRVEYLHSLPPFVKLWDEVEVVRRMVRQQASDAFTAKSVAGALRRASAAEAAVVASATHSLDNGIFENIKSYLDKIAQRVEALEKRQLSSINLSDEKEIAKSQVAVVISPGEEEQGYEHNKEREEEKEGIVQSGERIKKVENQLHNVSFHPFKEVGVENAIVTEIENRLRVLENLLGVTPVPFAVSGLVHDKQGSEKTCPGVLAPQSHVQLQPQRPATGVSAQESASAHTGKNVEQSSLATDDYKLTLTNLPVNHPGRKGSAIVTNPAQQVIDKSTVAPKRDVISFVDQSNTEAIHQSVQPPSLPNLQLQEQIQVQTEAQGRAQQAPAGESDIILRSIARLEEGLAELERKKADRRELAQLEETFRGLVEGHPGYSPYGMHYSSASRRPMSHNGVRIGSEVGYGVHGDSTRTALKSAPPCRPMFVGTASHNLRDSSGVITPATVLGSHSS